jgi:hypothetical protein
MLAVDPPPASFAGVGIGPKASRSSRSCPRLLVLGALVLVRFT